MAETKGDDTPDQSDTIVVDSDIVACNGGGGALGHPVVYLNLGDEGEVVCPYCSRNFVLAAGAPHAAAH